MDLSIGLLIITSVFCASLGLNLSSITLMSGHALSQRSSQQQLRHLLICFSFGAMAAIFLLTSTILLLRWQIPHITYYPTLIILLIIQTLIMLLIKVFQASDNLNPWTLRQVRKFIQQRCIKTNSGAEAISLGIFSVLSNIWLLFLPLFNLAGAFSVNQFILPIITIISFITTLPFLSISLVIVLRVQISRIHRFLISNATFLHIVSLLSLILACWQTVSLIFYGGIR